VRRLAKAEERWARLRSAEERRTVENAERCGITVCHDEVNVMEEK